MVYIDKFLDGIPFSAFKKKKKNKMKRTVKRGKKKKITVKKMKKMKRTVKRVKRGNNTKRTKIPPSGVILRKNGRLFKSDGHNLKLID